MKRFLTTEQQEALSRAVMNIDSLTSTILLGPVGSGKTEILNAIADNYDTKIWTKSEITAIFASKGFTGLQQIIDSPYLLLDDIEMNVNLKEQYGQKCDNAYDYIIKSKLDKMKLINDNYTKLVGEIETLQKQWNEGRSPYNSEEWTSVMSSKEHARKNWENTLNSKLFITTNASIEEMSMGLSDKVIDRIKSQCKVTPLVTLESYRKMLTETE